MIVENNVIFIQTNILATLDKWTVTNGEKLANGRILLHANGTATYQLSDVIGDAFKPCKFMRCIAQVIDPSITENYNYQNIVEVVTKFKYVNLNSETTSTYDIIPITRYGALKDPTTQIITVQNDYVSMNQTITEGSVMVRNNSDHDVTVVAVALYRSNDLTGQLDGIGTGGSGVRPTKMDILCERQNWTIDTIDDVIYLVAVFPDDMPSHNSIGDGLFRWSVGVHQGYPNVACIFNNNSFGNNGSMGYSPLRIPVQGVRNGILDVTLTYVGSGEHYGEYVTRQVTIINCDPTTITLEYDGEEKVNGFDGTPVAVVMSPHRWYTYYEFEESGTGFRVAEPAVRKEYLKSVIGLSRGDTIDGGQYTFARQGNAGSVSNIEPGAQTSLYGVWNGYQEIIADASVVVKNRSTMNADMILRQAVEIVGCEHTITLQASESEVTELGKIVKVEAISTPAGVPFIGGSTGNNPSRPKQYWTVTSGVTELNSGVIGGPEWFEFFQFNSIINEIVTIATQIYTDALNLSPFDIQIPVNIAHPGYELVSENGATTFNEMGTQLYFYIPEYNPAIWGNRVRWVISKDGDNPLVDFVYGVATAGSSRMSLTSRKQGKANIQLKSESNPNLITEKLPVTVDYTAQWQSMQLTSSNGEFKVGLGNSIQIKVENWPFSTAPAVAITSIDGGAAIRDQSQSWPAGVIVLQGTAVGSVEVIISDSGNLYGFYKRQVVEVVESLGKPYLLVPEGGSDIAKVPQAGVFFQIQDYTSELFGRSPRINISSDDGATSSGQDFPQSNTGRFYVKPNLPGTLAISCSSTVSGSQLQTKTFYLHIDYTETIENATVVSSTGEFTVPVGQQIVLSLQGWPITIASNQIAQAMTEGGKVNINSVSNQNITITGQTAGKCQIIINQPNYGLYKVVNITVTAS